MLQKAYHIGADYLLMIKCCDSVLRITNLLRFVENSSSACVINQGSFQNEAEEILFRSSAVCALLLSTAWKTSKWWGQPSTRAANPNYRFTTAGGSLPQKQQIGWDVRSKSADASRCRRYKQNESQI